MANILQDYRENTWTAAESPSTITREIHWTNNTTPYQIQLLELPQEVSPSTVTAEVIDVADEAILIGDLSFDVQNAAWFTNGNTIQIDNEQLLVGVVAAPVINVTRAQNGTAAAAHDNRSLIRILSSMTEQTKTTSVPPAGHFQVDYATGLVRFAQADNGKRVGISYSGLGQLCCEKWNADLGQYFGTGADGALAIASGATSQLQGEKNYTSAIIAGTLTYPAGPTQPLVVRVQGNLWVKDAGLIDVSGFGSAGGAAGSNNGTDGRYGGAGGGGGSGISGAGAGGNVYTNLIKAIVGGGGAAGSVSVGGNGDNALALPYFLGLPLIPGAGGGGGGGNGTDGAGGNGGGIVIICARRMILDIDSTIDASGDNGANADNGGGGGGGGLIVIIYQELINSGTINVAGGTGGTGVTAGGNGGNGQTIYVPV